MPVLKSSHTLSPTLAAIGLAFFAVPAHGELFFSIYGGTMYTHDSDVHLKQDGGTDETFHDVQWDAEPFKGSLYGGYRLGYWFDRSPHWGISAEWIHGKMIADLNQEVEVSGTSSGVPVSGSQPLGNTFDNLQLTHGHNLYLVNVHHRWFLGDAEEKSFWSRFEPYVGLGAGLARPHVEVIANGTSEYNFQEAGFGLQGFAGLNVNLFRYLSIFTEYKLTYASIDAELPNGSLEVDPLSHHLVVGLTVHFGRAKH